MPTARDLPATTTLPAGDHQRAAVVLRGAEKAPALRDHPVGLVDEEGPEDAVGLEGAEDPEDLGILV